MEDLITLVIAIAIGLFSMLAGQRNKNKKTPQKGKTEELDYIPPEVLERELSTETSTASKSTQPSALDVLGRILTGDLSDLVGQPKPKPQAAESEYVDPMIAGRKRQTQRNEELKERRYLEELKFAKVEKPPSATSKTLHDPALLRQAIIISEVLDRPISKRRRTKVG